MEVADAIVTHQHICFDSDNTRMNRRIVIRSIALLALVAIISWFFYTEIRRHWLELSTVQIEIQLPYLFTAVFLVMGGYLVATLAWRHSLMLTCGRNLPIQESIGVVNIAQLTKYLPGKIWFYAIQMHLLANRGFSKATTVSLNLLMLASLAGSAVVSGLAATLISNTQLPVGLAPTLLIFATIAYFALFFTGSWLFDIAIMAANRIFKTNHVPLRISPARGLIIHLLYLFSNLLYGTAGYATAFAIGADNNLALLLPIGGAMLLSDLVGFLAFAMPGGIGVREGIMYAMLRSLLDIRLCFVLPVAFRLVTTIADLCLGSLALWFLRKSSSGKVKSTLQT